MAGGRRASIVAAAVMAALVAAAVPTVAATEGQGSDEQQQASKPKKYKLSVGLRVKGFRAGKRNTTARAIAVASLRDSKGRTKKVKQPVTLRVAQRRSCRILFLELDKLDLDLLGLNIHLDKVRLKITGRARGGVLGRLFCKLSRSNVKVSQRRKAARALTARARKSKGRIVGFRAPIYPKSTASQESETCQVLQLTLGPLDLDLLGLVVELNEVRLNITATRGAGVLGDLFCQLADSNNASTQEGSTQTQSAASQ